MGGGIPPTRPAASLFVFLRRRAPLIAPPHTRLMPPFALTLTAGRRRDGGCACAGLRDAARSPRLEVPLASPRGGEGRGGEGRVTSRQGFPPPLLLSILLTASALVPPSSFPNGGGSTSPPTSMAAQSHPTPCSGGADPLFRQHLFGRWRDSTFSPLAGLRPVPRPSTLAPSNGLSGQHAPAAVDTGAGRRAEKWVPHLSLRRPNPAPPRPPFPQTRALFPVRDLVPTRPPTSTHECVTVCARIACTPFPPPRRGRGRRCGGTSSRVALVVGPAGALHPSRLGRGGAADPAPLAASPVLPRPRCS
jgi:hypothetical protein